METSNSGSFVVDSDLLLPFELIHIQGDYREFLKTRRNNCFATMQGFADLWKAFTELDSCWRAGIDLMERVDCGADQLSMALYIRAHAQTRISAELWFSGCTAEAANILRVGIECAVHAYRIQVDPGLEDIWLESDKQEKRRAYAEAFEKEKRERLFKGLKVLHSYYTQFSDLTHPNIRSLAAKSKFSDVGDQSTYLYTYFEIDPVRLRAHVTVSIHAAAEMERLFFKSFSTRLALDVAHTRRRSRVRSLIQSIVEKAASPSSPRPDL